MNNHLRPERLSQAASPHPNDRVADTVARTLYTHGIRHAFGMPGGEVVTLVDALEAVGIRFVLMRQESSAAIAAAATSHFTRAPGLLVTTLGPGLANAVNGIADAAQERMPLLVLSGVVDRTVRGCYTHQVLDHAALMRGVGVKASFEIEPGDPAAVVARAIGLSLTPPFGPVHLDLAPGTAATSAERQGIGATRSRRVQLSADPRGPDLEEARHLLEQARRPVVIAGFEAARAGPSVAGALADLATRHGVPVITTYKGKGVVDEGQSFALGAAGLSPKADEVLLPLVREADLVLLVGYDPIEMRPGWLNPFGAETTVVELTAAPVDHGMHLADLTLVGPLAGALSTIGAAKPAPRWPASELAGARSRLERLFAPPASWGPHAVVDALRRVLPDEATVTVDSGAHRILLSQRWTARSPLTLLQSTGWCTMGAALPLAIGTSLAAPQRPVVAVVGDGGIEMVLGELGTLRDQSLPVVVLVLQDASLALIELKQRQAGLMPNGIGLGRTDLAAVAQAFGGDGAVVQNIRALEEALRAGLQRHRFSLIACPIESESYVGCI
jgi:acetolactate synthase-1/2/3 large subunit